MLKHRSLFQPFVIARSLLRWLLLVIPVAVTVGSLVAFFLWLLGAATSQRWGHPWLIFLLPVAGAGIYWLYRLWGGNSERGNNLIIEEIHEPGGGVPVRMAPLVLATTVITHLFGGSAGREGTAVQMGGSIAGLYGRWYRLGVDDTRILLMAGIAAGFGAVFGTPVAGTVFALEVLAIGTVRYNALLPCFIAAVIADHTTAAWGIAHVHYSLVPGLVASGNSSLLHGSIYVLLQAIAAGMLFGITAYVFSALSHIVKSGAKTLLRIEWLIPVAGGLLIIAGCCLLGTTDYLGLGVTGPAEHSINIVNAFHVGGVTSYSWLWKLLFTVVTLSTGFKGGEVTPLFFIGAALGNAIAVAMGAPVALFAAMGFIAVFAGAANTPLACTLMGIELFGADYTIYFAAACFVAYYFSGHTGIYTAQRLSAPKANGMLASASSLQQLHNESTTYQRRYWKLLKRKWRN